MLTWVLRLEVRVHHLEEAAPEDDAAGGEEELQEGQHGRRHRHVPPVALLEGVDGEQEAQRHGDHSQDKAQRARRPGARQETTERLLVYVEDWTGVRAGTPDPPRNMMAAQTG
jgi:hypothetical protein